MIDARKHPPPTPEEYAAAELLAIRFQIQTRTLLVQGPHALPYEDFGGLFGADILSPAWIDPNPPAGWVVFRSPDLVLRPEERNIGETFALEHTVLADGVAITPAARTKPIKVEGRHVGVLLPAEVSFAVELANVYVEG